MVSSQVIYYFCSIDFLSSLIEAPVKKALIIPGIIKGYRPPTTACSKPTNNESCGIPIK
jgi:hypothetical protein